MAALLRLFNPHESGMNTFFRHGQMTYFEANGALSLVAHQSFYWGVTVTQTDWETENVFRQLPLER